MNLRFFTHTGLIALFSLSSFVVSAQQSEINTNDFANYNHALSLYKNNAYAAAQQTFKNTALLHKSNQTLQANTQYYIALCAIKLNQPSAENKILDFVKKHPESDKIEQAYLTAGNYYFDHKNTNEALKWYQKITATALPKATQDELDFKMGYAQLENKNYDAAKNHFQKLLNSATYKNDATYYFGFIAYKQQDFATAEKYLSKSAQEQSYTANANYNLLDIYFKNASFDKCITIGKQLLADSNATETSEISKVVGESYFNLKKFKEAIPYLEAYQGKNGKWNNTDYYLLGYAYYKQQNFKKAVQNFNKIIGQTNAVSQNAYYHLAECYLALNKKLEALNAFKNASEMAFDAKIKQDAFLNYAKLSYEEGNPYKSVASVLQDFLANYPNSPHYKEINTLIVTSFVHQQDYQGALNYLAKKQNAENNELKKEVSFYRGVQLFSENTIEQALAYFNTATHTTDQKISASASYWKAESNYQLEKYSQALNDFLAFQQAPNAALVNQYKSVDYNIAYSYFKLKEYKKAATHFSSFLAKNSSNPSYVADASIRLADCYFVSKQYQKAISAYQKIIDNKFAGADYAQYQKGISFGFLNQNDKKVTNLLVVVNFYTTSNLKDDALFQLANTYAQLKNNKKAHAAYAQLINQFPNSSYVSKGLLRDGLLYYNENNNQKALEKYKQVVSAYPDTNEAKQAVKNARNVYVDMGQVEDYAAWVKNISFVNVTNADIDNSTYEAAEKKFLANNTHKAIAGFEKYLKTFPEGLHALKAHFYLAQSLSKLDEPEKATPHYQYVVDKNQNEFSEEALNKLSQIYLEKENWSAAMPLLTRLEKEANYAQNITFAQSNLMKGYYQNKQYKNAVAYAEKVLKKEKLDAQVSSDAKIIIARSAFETGDLKTAKQFYSEVEKTAEGEVKAEALYFNAYFKNKAKAYTESNKVVQNLIANYSTYKYWGVKSYLIMAKNYYGLKDAYQATYILKNIIKNFTQFPDVINIAKKELESIKANEAKTNESVKQKN